jgi:hypothetical protein
MQSKTAGRKVRLFLFLSSGESSFFDAKTGARLGFLDLTFL